MLKKWVLGLALYILSLNPVLAKDIMIGQGSLHYLIWHVYDATLYASDKSFSFDKPFKLHLDYKRDLKGDDIADRSAQEIRQLGLNDEVKLATWHAQMKAIFPDIKDGVRLTGVYAPNKPTIFYKNNAKIGVIKDPDFGKWFFRIWLDRNTSEPELRQALLGINQ